MGGSRVTIWCSLHEAPGTPTLTTGIWRAARHHYNGAWGDIPVTRGCLPDGEICIMVLMLPKVLVIMQTFLGRSIYPFTCKELHYTELCTRRNSYPKETCPSQQVLLRQLEGWVHGGGPEQNEDGQKEKENSFHPHKPQKACPRISILWSSLCYLDRRTLFIYFELVSTS